jgi:pimeloyl-ACP methyl ester carboxylesterase
VTADGPVPEPDREAAPNGFIVEADPATRLHFLDWGGPDDDATPRILLLHGLGQTAWSWSPVARRLLRVARVIAADLRGHGLSDAPTEGYDAVTFAADTVATAEGSGLLAADGPPIVIAGHGFGAIVAAWTALVLGSRVAGLVLVDGGWENLEESSGVDAEEFLRGLDEPPEVLRSMEAYLADRRDFDPASWDADQEAATRATVVEQHSKRVTPVTRPHVVAACVDAMFAYAPLDVLPAIDAPIVALQAADDEWRRHGRALEGAQAAVGSAGRPPIAVVRFPDAGHNLMRYRPSEVAAAVLAAGAGTLRR